MKLDSDEAFIFRQGDMLSLEFITRESKIIARRNIIRKMFISSEETFFNIGDYS